MNKYLVMLLVIFGVVSCTVRNDQYYRSHPRELQAALKECANHQFQGTECEKLQQLGQRMSYLAYQLQSSPQGFGAIILSLQEKIAQQESAAASNKLTAEEKQSLTENKERLVEYLAVVKWLESPES